MPCSHVHVSHDMYMSMHMLYMCMHMHMCMACMYMLCAHLLFHLVENLGDGLVQRRKVQLQTVAAKHEAMERYPRGRERELSFVPARRLP